MSLGIEPATVAGVGDVPDASRFSDADFAAVAKMQASARRHLDETHRDPAPTEAMPTLDDADAANVKKMQASARALLERRQTERRAAKAEARARVKRRDAEGAEGLEDAEDSSSSTSPPPRSTSTSVRSLPRLGTLWRRCRRPLARTCRARRRLTCRRFRRRIASG